MIAWSLVRSQPGPPRLVDHPSWADRRLRLADPGRRPLEQVLADREAAVERVAELLLAEVHAIESDLDAGDHD